MKKNVLYGQKLVDYDGKSKKTTYDFCFVCLLLVLKKCKQIQKTYSQDHNSTKPHDGNHDLSGTGKT